MDDKQRAIEALTRAGFDLLSQPDGVFDHPSGTQVEIEPDVEWQDGTVSCVWVRHKDLPAFLNPLTMEMVAEAVRFEICDLCSNSTELEITISNVLIRLRQQIEGGADGG